MIAVKPLLVTFYLVGQRSITQVGQLNQNHVLRGRPTKNIPTS